MEKRDAEKHNQTFSLSLFQSSKFPRFTGVKEVVRMEREQRDNSLHTIVIILLCCGAVKLLHLLGVISVEGESHQNPSEHHQNRLYLKMFSHGKLAEEKCRIYSVLQTVLMKPVVV